MNLADKPCYPIHYTNEDGEARIESGLTFREMLIVALAGNPGVMTTRINDAGQASINPAGLIQVADAIIKHMEAANA